MSTPTPTPRTYAAKIKSGFAAIPDGFYDHARGLETELNAATTECDQLRAALALGQQNCDDAYDDLRTERDAALARAERGEASLHAATEECTDVRLKWHTVMGTCAAKEDAIIELDEELARLRARAERAEADAAAERARLDSGQIMLIVAGERVWCSGVDLRAAIDAGMREGAK